MKGCIFARRYVAPSRGAVDPSDDCSGESAHCATGGYLRADANACAQRRRACSRSSTACFCAGTRTTYVTTAWSATAANDGWLSPHEIFYGNHPPMALLPYFQPAYHRVHRQRKSDPRARLYYFLNIGYNHGHDCHKLLDAETGKVLFSREVTWHHPEAPLIPPTTAVGNPPTARPGDIYVPMPTPVPSVAAPALAPVPPASAPAPAPPTSPPPVPMSNSSAPIPSRVSRGRAHEEYVEIPGRTRGETRAMHDASREYAHRHSQCWRRVKRYTTPYTNTAPLRTFQPRVHQSFTLRRTFLRRRCHRTGIYGDTP